MAKVRRFFISSVKLDNVVSSEKNIYLHAFTSAWTGTGSLVPSRLLLSRSSLRSKVLGYSPGFRRFLLCIRISRVRRRGRDGVHSLRLRLSEPGRKEGCFLRGRYHRGRCATGRFWGCWGLPVFPGIFVHALFCPGLFRPEVCLWSRGGLFRRW